MTSPTVRWPFARLGVVASVCGLMLLSQAFADNKEKPVPIEKALFDQFLAKNQDLTRPELEARLKPRDYLKKLSFDATQVQYFDRIKQQLQLTDEELALYKANGFVSVDMKRRHAFGSAYYQIYAQDLPVLVTTDSIMHALHRSYDQILMELEANLFAHLVDEILTDCQKANAERAAKNKDATLAKSYRDVDLYLTIARNLLAGAAAPAKKDLGDPFAEDEWGGDLRAKSDLGQDNEVLARLKDIQSLKIQLPLQDLPTKIYGGERFMDYSQFRPRGHYTKSSALKRYFRCLMWLGRVDCGWNVLPTNPAHGITGDSNRELRDAILLSELIQATGSVPRLRAMDDVINFMVGRSDNLSVFQLLKLLKDHKIATLADAADDKTLSTLKEALRTGKYGEQFIRSQIVTSHVGTSVKTPPPDTFQMFGQRFIIDSFVLSQVVFDSILYKNKKQRRMMPQGLDVMAALGNNEAIPLLREELDRWNYAGNLAACREFVDALKPTFWKDNLYNLWLDALRVLDEDMSNVKNAPEVMRTQAWQMKQLQTQLGSWAELRHDTILYAKQSYTAYPVCEYPAGFVEPYPQFYARVKFFAEEAARLFEAADYTSKDKGRTELMKDLKQRQVQFFRSMAATVGRLETLAQKELAAKPFSDEEKTFLKKTIDMRGGGSGPPRYDGWYCHLFYHSQECSKWEPIVVDVHTDPESKSVLEVATGDVNLCVIAIDNEKDRACYVGPIFSYYEFHQPTDKRLTDQEWQQRIYKNELPERPAWTKVFQAPAKERKDPLPVKARP